MTEDMPQYMHEINKELAGLRSLMLAMQATNDERDRRYLEKFEAVAKSAEAAGLAAGTAVAAALAAQEKAVASAFAAQEKSVAAINEARDKAILKAEEALRDYKVAANEFRGTLADLASRLLSRTEADVRFAAADKSLDDFKVGIQVTIDQIKRDGQITRDEIRLEIATLNSTRGALFETIRKDMQGIRDELRNELGELRQSRDVGVGQSSQSDRGRAQTITTITTVIAVIGLLITLAAFVITQSLR